MDDFSFSRSGTHQPPPRRQQRRSSAFSTPDNSTSFAATPRRTPGRRGSALDDASWQSSVSWQPADTSWAQPHGLGAAVGPWAPAGSDAASRRGPALFRRTARDYYLSKRSSRMMMHHHRSSAAQQSRSVAAASAAGGGGKRLELQSVVTDASRALVVAPNTSFASNDDVIISTATPGPAAKAVVKYSGDTHYVSREVSFSRDNRDKLYVPPRRGRNDAPPSFGYDDDASATSYSRSQHYGGGGDEDDYDLDLDLDLDDDDGEIEVRVGKPISLAGLFKYSAPLDVVLLVLGCVGAMVNGGSLPWYSYLFGNFINKVVNTDKSQMMKDVKQVILYYIYAALMMVLLAAGHERTDLRCCVGFGCRSASTCCSWLPPLSSARILVSTANARFLGSWHSVLPLM